MAVKDQRLGKNARPRTMGIQLGRGLVLDVKGKKRPVFSVWDEVSDWDAKGCKYTGNKSKDGFRGEKKMVSDNKVCVLRLAKILNVSGHLKIIEASILSC